MQYEHINSVLVCVSVVLRDLKYGKQINMTLHICSKKKFDKYIKFYEVQAIALNKMLLWAAVAKERYKLAGRDHASECYTIKSI